MIRTSRKNTTFKLYDVRKLLMEALGNVTADKWRKCVEHVIKQEQQMWDLDEIVEDIIEPIIISIRPGDTSSEYDEDSD